MEAIRDILINLLSDAIWALGGFLVARFLFSKGSFRRKIAAALRKNCLDRKVIQEPADDVYQSSNALQYGFEHVFGRAIHEYQVSRRMLKAYDLLLQRDKSIKEIARLVGYKNASSFSLGFKKHLG